MDKTTQDLAWACLPKETREKLKSMIGHCTLATETTLADLYGYHNLTSDTEPEEVLIVKRKKVQEILEMHERAGNKVTAMVIKALFGDKCLPDKDIPSAGSGEISTTPPTYKLDVKPEQPSVQCEPKFNKGDLVKCITDGKIYEVKGKTGKHHYALKGSCYDAHEDNLEPYTEPETKEDAPRPHKYSVGQKVLNPFCKSEILTIAALAGHSDKNNPRYRVLDYPCLWNECELEPFIEPTYVSGNETKDETKEKGNNEEKQGNFEKIPNHIKNIIEEKAKEYAKKTTPFAAYSSGLVFDRL